MAGEDGNLVGGFAEMIGDLFMDAVVIALVALVLLIFAILIIIGRFALPRPFNWILGLCLLGGMVYVIHLGGFI